LESPGPDGSNESSLKPFCQSVQEEMATKGGKIQWKRKVSDRGTSQKTDLGERDKTEKETTGGNERKRKQNQNQVQTINLIETRLLIQLQL
jgi:hypothetical protein